MINAHGDIENLINFLSCQDAAAVKQIFLVHGEYAVQEAFAARLQRKGYEKIVIPGMHEEFEL